MKANIVRILGASTLLFAASFSWGGALTATIIGSGSPVFNEDRASASVLISNGVSKILLDMGNCTQANLAKLKVNDKTLDALMFTHHHLDHNEEFLPILIHSLLGKQNFVIYGPPHTQQMTNSFIALFEEDINYRLSKSKRDLSDRQNSFKATDLKGSESFQIGGIKVTSLKVPHTIHAIAYRFDYQGQSILVTGDLTYSDQVAVLAKNADYLIIDSGGMQMNQSSQRKGKKNTTKKYQVNQKVRKSGKTSRNGRVIAHLNLAESSMIAKEAKVKNLVYTHFAKGEVDTEASMKIIRTHYQGKVIFAQDLMVLE
jgi:ribonuclease BN (tRNA processing enzyme)